MINKTAHAIFFVGLCMLFCSSLLKGQTKLFTVHPDTTGCDTMTVLFDNIYQKLEYRWDFDNGDTSQMKQPSSVFYGQPGKYQPSLTIDSLFVLHEMTVEDIPGNWQDLFDPSPDLYFYVIDSTPDTAVYVNKRGNTNDNIPHTFSNVDLQLFDRDYTIEVYEYDGFAGDDYLGKIHFDGYGFSNTKFSNDSSLKVSYKIGRYIDYTYTQPIRIYESPQKPIITSFVSFGGIELAATPIDGDSMQWYKGSSLIAGANDSIYQPTESGVYSIEVIDTVCPSKSTPYKFYASGFFRKGDTNQGLSLYPNPASRVIHVHFKHPLSQVYTFRLLSVKGEAVYSKRVYKGDRHLEIPIDEIAEGTYLLHLIGKEKRIVRQVEIIR